MGAFKESETKCWDEEKTGGEGQREREMKKRRERERGGGESDDERNP